MSPGAVTCVDVYWREATRNATINKARKRVYRIKLVAVVRQESAAKKRSMALRAAIFAAAFGAGIISSLFGVGGGIIFVPAMLVILGIGIYRAAATSQLILMITSVAGVLTHVALGHPDYFYAIALSAGAFVGAQIGARMSKSTKEAILNKMLSIALMAIGGKMILDWMLSR